MDYYNIIEKACSDVGISFSDEKYNKFLNYKDLLNDWNKKINLTAITEDIEIIKKHFIDSIKIFKFEPLKEFHDFIDIGTGAGFPGIPISILRPNTNMVLLDSLNKRINFLNEVANSISLKGIRTVHGRAEEVCRKKEYREHFEAALSRAVANLRVLSELCIPYVKLGGYFVAMKGPSVENEIEESKSTISALGGRIEEVIEIEIEESDLKHNLVVIRKAETTPATYPRKFANILKKPLK